MKQLSTGLVVQSWQLILGYKQNTFSLNSHLNGCEQEIDEGFFKYNA